MGFNADIKKAKEDCIFFGNRYFSHLITLRCSSFHRKLIKIADASNHDRISILAPRGHAKSTWLSVIYPIWKIVNNRDIKIIIVSDTADQAETYFRNIKDELEANERLYEDFGDFYEGPKSNVWKANDITVSGALRSKEPTIVCCGTGKRIVGRRADIIIVDDPLNDENTENEKQRKKTLRWFRKTLTPIVNPDTGRIIVIGTRKHPDDLHRELGKNPRYKQYVFRALDNENNTVLWPERWPKQRLLREKDEIGSIVFAQEYQNEPISEENSYFRREWIEKCYSRGSHFQNYYFGNKSVFTGWDLSLVTNRIRAEEKDSDYTVGITIELGDDGTRTILDIYRVRGITPSQIINVITSKAARFNPTLITIENNLFQCLYEQQLISTTDLPIVGHTTGREKMDVFKGVPSLSVLFENGKYQLPRGDKQSVELTDILTNELIGLGIETHDDTVMALWIAECGIRRKMNELRSNMEIIDDPTWRGF
ncbi:terminase large subunit domain-containing protein [Candidatus Latescibacterota bacterium]